MMEAFGKRRTAGDLSPLLKNGKAGYRGGTSKGTGVALPLASANVDISKENRVQGRISLQPARNHDEFRTEKLRHLKTMILKGEYDVDPRKVARSFLRAAISWPVEKRLIQSIIVELTEIVSLAEQETVAGDGRSAHSSNIKPNPNDLSRKIPC
ncbi:MAG TPA: flagellar biosynthesis anti-sigma factor FlgM [Candidatus Binatia bacterium]|jgi:anti-sigma28 factor (negative regulator of flagellin synthesis)